MSIRDRQHNKRPNMPTSIEMYDEFVFSVVGDGSVGKSSLTTRLVQGTFDQQQGYDPTIEDAYYVKRNVDNMNTQLEIIDTAGQEGKLNINF